MNWLLDTDICIYWLKGDQKIEKKVMQVGLGNLQVSFVTISELYYGAFKSQRTPDNVLLVEKLEEKLAVVESDSGICSTYGKLKAQLEKQVAILDDADIFVAACAQATDSVLVTNNEKHFSRIKDIKIENWSKLES